MQFTDFFPTLLLSHISQKSPEVRAFAVKIVVTGSLYRIVRTAFVTAVAGVNVTVLMAPEQSTILPDAG